MDYIPEQNLSPSRGKLLNNLFGLSPIFVMTIFLIDFKDWFWWRYLAGMGAWYVVYKLYAIIFDRLVCPKDVDRREIDSSIKFVYYTAVVGFSLVCISIYSFLPFGFVANLTISIVINFLMTMWFCYYVAKAPKEKERA